MIATVWIPAFAGMTEAKTNFETYPYKPIKGEGICRPQSRACARRALGRVDIRAKWTIIAPPFHLP